MSNSFSNEKKRLLKNASWLFSSDIIGSVFAALEVIVLARFLGLEQFGLFSIVVSYVNIVNGIVDFNVREAVIRYVGKYREAKDSVKTLSFVKLFYLIDFLSGAVAFVAAVLLAGIANSLFIKSENAIELVFIYSFSLFVSTVNVNSRSLLEVFQKFDSVALFEVAGVVLRVSLVIAALLSGFGIKGVFVAYVIGKFANFCFLQFFVNRTLRAEGLGRWFSAEVGMVKNEIKDVMLFVLNSTFVGFASNVFSRNFPILVLGYFSGSEASGLYKTATVFLKIIGKLKTPASRALYPALVSLQERKSYEDFKRIISYSVRFLAKLFVPVAGLFFIFADTILLIFFGAEYVPAATAMRIIIVVETFALLFFWVGSVCLALGRTWFRTGLTLVSTLLYTAALFYLASAHSIEGAALAKLVLPLTFLPVAVILFRDIKRRAG
ncbi:oligosaccharide flippase family protein [Candidatus Mycalebacterium sp.]